MRTIPFPTTRHQTEGELDDLEGCSKGLGQTTEKCEAEQQEPGDTSEEMQEKRADRPSRTSSASSATTHEPVPLSAAQLEHTSSSWRTKPRRALTRRAASACSSMQTR